MNYKPLNSAYRHLFVGVDAQIPLSDGTLVTAINFDNAATTPPLHTVLQEINDFASLYSSVHRGTGYKAQVSSHYYEQARLTVGDFVGADLDRQTVIFVKNTTEGINKLAYRLCSASGKDVVLVTAMEHHSNDLPWRHKYRVDYIEVDAYGRLRLDDLEHKLHRYRGSVKLVAATGASNVTGYVNPIHQIAELAHHYQAEVLIDGAQLVPHAQVNLCSGRSGTEIDYLAFSGHKMYAPFGTGVLIGPKETFSSGKPEYVGGGTVRTVTRESVVWNPPPEKEEAGTPNLMGVLALVQAIKSLQRIGMENVEEHENKLTEYFLGGLHKLPGVDIYRAPGSRGIGVIVFNIRNLHHSIAAQVLADKAGIAVRSGCFCAQPYVQRLLGISREELQDLIRRDPLLRPGMVRASFGIYNNYREIDNCLRAVHDLVENRSYYLRQYQQATGIKYPR